MKNILVETEPAVKKRKNDENDDASISYSKSSSKKSYKSTETAIRSESKYQNSTSYNKNLNTKNHYSDDKRQNEKIF